MSREKHPKDIKEKKTGRHHEDLEGEDEGEEHSSVDNVPPVVLERASRGSRVEDQSQRDLRRSSEKHSLPVAEKEIRSEKSRTGSDRRSVHSRDREGSIEKRRKSGGEGELRSQPEVSRGSHPEISRGSNPEVGRGSRAEINRGSNPEVGRGSRAEVGRGSRVEVRVSRAEVSRGSHPEIARSSQPEVPRGSQPEVGRGSQHSETGSRGLRRSSQQERSSQKIPTVQEINEDLPTTPSRHPLPPVPDEPEADTRHSEYEHDEYDERDERERDYDEGGGDPKLRAELYPLEDSLHRRKYGQGPRASDEGSHINLISAQTYGQSPRQRSESYRYQTVSSRDRFPREVSAPRKVSSRNNYLPPDREDSAFPASFVGDRRDAYVRPDDSRRGDSFRRRSGETRFSGSKHLNYSILKEEDDTVERRASVLLPVLEDTERIFHELVVAGDVDAIRLFLQKHPGFNINCVNYQKISALHMAVKEQNEAMVEFLLQQNGLDISDCALYAIKSGNIKITEMILDKIREKFPGLEFAGATHSVDFPDDMTPLILAAQLGNYEMIDFLIKRDHFIPPVHPPFCKCDACRADLKKYDRLRYSTMKVNLYKAICNPMYIFHTTNDPFQRAFELTQELQDAATVFPPFRSSFQELWSRLRAFSVDLIGCCRNSQEVEIILKKAPGSVAEYIKFPRLQYAIDLKQKEFVSHPYTQAVLGDAWTGDLLEWKVRSPLMQSLSVLPRIPMLPIMAVMCIILPNHSLVRKWKTPVNKMISSVASYLIFLVIIFVESNLDKSNQKRGPPNSGLEGIIILYVVGYIWLHIRTCFKQGVKRFFSVMWHCYDTIMLFLFVMTIVFWIASWVDITANNDVDLPRKYWNSLDPELVAEGFFATAVIMAFFRLNLFLALNYHLGPLQVSIGKMTLDIFRFIIIFFIIMLAWCAGLCRFYQPYAGMVQKDAASGNTTTQVPSFVSFLMTLKTFFWAIFGMSPIESADVVIENLPGDTPGTTIINQHHFTEAVGYIAFAFYQFLSVVVVLNMLVACMANTFTKVIDNVSVEWVFGRSQVYLSFMAASVLPPPLNLIPTASGVRDMIKWFRLMAKPSDGQRAKCSLAHCCFIESETEAYVNNEFPSLMSELAQRYIRTKVETEEEDTNHDIDELKMDMSEVKDILRKLNVNNICRPSTHKSEF